MRVWFGRYWKQLLALMLCIIVPLLIFGEIAEDIHKREAFNWEVPLMETIRNSFPVGFKPVAVALSLIGSGKIMVPVVLGLILLLWRKSHTMARYFIACVGGAMLLNVLAKLYFQRARPDFLVRYWQESDYSFPSGHATMAMALVAALSMLLWRTRWRYFVLVVGAVYVVLMSVARVYVGVHYPTDVIGGAASALAWVAGVSFIYRPRLRRAQAHAVQEGQFEETETGETVHELPR